MDPLAADKQFFSALLGAEQEALDQVLTDDFILIDVMSGSEISKPTLLGAVASGIVQFESIEVIESKVRSFPNTAVVTGSTRMRGRFGEAPFSAHSRYTHVYIEQQGRWQLGAAQGTPITS